MTTSVEGMSKPSSPTEVATKILKTSFPKLIIYDEDELPSPDIKWIVNNFEKI